MRIFETLKSQMEPPDPFKMPNTTNNLDYTWKILIWKSQFYSAGLGLFIGKAPFCRTSVGVQTRTLECFRVLQHAQIHGRATSAHVICSPCSLTDLEVFVFIVQTSGDLLVWLPSAAHLEAGGWVKKRTLGCFIVRGFSVVPLLLRLFAHFARKPTMSDGLITLFGLGARVAV